MHRTLSLLALILSTSVLLAGCGQKGDLYLPADEAQATFITDIGN
ncbi:LPS translocon maturation chaperone LptM [Saccharospirillum impatiens]|nr:lipoprotein [Saccharospirillum impatiens]